MLDQLTNQRKSIAARVVECAAVSTVEDVAQDVLLRCPEQFYLCGFSFGGYVSLAMLALAPERVLGIVLVNSSGLADTAEASAHRRKSIAASRDGQYRKIALAQQLLAFHPSSLCNSELERMYRTMVDEYGRERFEAHMQACIDRPDRLEFLRQIATRRNPARLVASDRRAIFVPRLNAESGAWYGLSLGDR